MFESLDSERVFGNDLPMSRTRVRRRRIVLALAFAGVVLVGPVSRAWGRATAPDRTADQTAVLTRLTADGAVRIYVVARGDTIWAVAAGSDPGRDPRPLVDAIEHLNGLRAGDLVPGQTLLIPVPEEDRGPVAG
jgi:hypothetical protein